MGVLRIFMLIAIDEGQGAFRNVTIFRFNVAAGTKQSARQEPTPAICRGGAFADVAKKKRAIALLSDFTSARRESYFRSQQSSARKAASQPALPHRPSAW